MMASTHPPDEQSWSLDVMRGPNTGAHVALSSGSYRFGREAGNDIVLADPTVATEQAVLRLDASVAMLDALAPGITIGRRRAAPGRPVRLRNHDDITIGDTVLRVLGPARQRSRARFPVLLAGGALCATALFVTIMAPAAHRTTTQRLTAQAPAAGTRGTATPTSTADVAADLTRRMQDAGIAERMHISVKDGAIVAQGVIDSDAISRWNAIEQWFDARHGDLALISHVTPGTGPAMPHLDIRAVWAGPVPYVISTSGDKFTEGAVIDGGWTIARIGEDGVVLTRNGRSVRVQL